MARAACADTIFQELVYLHQRESIDGSDCMTASRVLTALQAVLPPQTPVEVNEDLWVTIAGTRLRVAWLPDGDPRSLRYGVDMIVAPTLTRRARDDAEKRGIGWVDEQGGASLTAGHIVIVKPGRPGGPQRSAWTPATLRVVEALLDGHAATVAATADATGLSEASTSRALRLLTDAELLTRDAVRGPHSARRVAGPAALLDTYLTKALAAHHAEAFIRVAVDPRSISRQLDRIAGPLEDREVRWALTGALAADLYAPLLTQPTPAALIIETQRPADLHAAARNGGFVEAEGGALTLLAFRGPGRLQRTIVSGKPCASKARTYADLIALGGVRAEDAGAHLRTHIIDWMVNGS